MTDNSFLFILLKLLIPHGYFKICYDEYNFKFKSHDREHNIQINLDILSNINDDEVSKYINVFKEIKNIVRSISPYNYDISIRSIKFFKF